MIRLRLARRAAVIALAGLICSAMELPATQREPSFDARLTKRVASYRLAAPDMLHALTTVAAAFDIPMGIYWVDAPGATHPVNRSWNNTTVREILTAIVRNQPGYEMRVQKDGLVRVLQADAIPDRRNFLKLRIKRFTVYNELVDGASRQLRDAVGRIVSPPPPPRPGARGGTVGSALGTLDYPKINLDVKSETVEEILDALAVESPRKIWIVTFEDDSKLTPTGFRRTRSLWNRNSIPDQYQPVWDMFHWGDKIPNP